jgi:GNAT superfamily N-acetyltransferase
MKTTHRPFVYESGDFARMCALTVHDCGIRGAAFTWHVARLVDWKYNIGKLARRFPGYYSKAAELWFDFYGELAGYVIFEDFDHRFECVLLPCHDHLYSEMVAWTVSARAERYEALETTLVSDDAAGIKALAAFGFEKNDELEKTYRFDTSRFADQAPPPSPLRFMSMAANGDYEPQAKLRLSAWPHDDPPEADRAIRAYCRTSPIYDAAFDFVLVDSGGRHISGCEAFIDRENGTAEIERVCTLAGENGKGYARMTLNSCLRALHEGGIGRAYLSGGYDKTIHLYGSLGHVEEVSRHFYVRKK